MKALSIRQPWAWLIVNGHKPVENRTWQTKFRGPVLIHAGQQCTAADYEAAMLFIQAYISPALLHQVPRRDVLQRGGIVGMARITDCVTEHCSPWFTGGAAHGGGTGFVMADAKPLPFMLLKGSLRFFDVPGEWK